METWSGKDMTRRRVLIIGLDGVTWKLLIPWTQKGVMPNLLQLMKGGSWGNLESTIPPITGPAWASFATGANPGRHGCFDFIQPDRSLSNLRTITTKTIKTETFYEILDRFGKKCIIVNLPCSYPPRIDGVVITSFLSPEDDFIFPPDLARRIPELSKYRIAPNLKFALEGKIHEYVKDVIELEKVRFDCAKKLIRFDWDFFFYLISGTDWIQHQSYEKMVHNDTRSESIEVRAYKEIDSYIGWLKDNVPNNTTIIVMSDHGFDIRRKVFFVNGWLQKSGHLKVRTKSGKHEEAREAMLGKFQEARSSRAKLRLPRIFQQILPNLPWLYPLYLALKKVFPIEIKLNLEPDIVKSIALSTSSPACNYCGIYINRRDRFTEGNIDPEEYESVRDNLMLRLKDIREPVTNKVIITSVWKGEDLYPGDRSSDAPDIIFELADDYQVSPTLNIPKPFDDFIGTYRVGHSLQGILVVYGKEIRKGAEIEGARIWDIAPTVLHFLGQQVPESMDGRVLREILKPDSKLAEREIRYQKIEEKDIIKERIKNLKKLGRI